MKFVAALAEMTGEPVTESLMKAHAVVCQGLVFFRSISDAGFQIDDIHSAQDFLQLGVKSAARAFSAKIPGDVYRGFHRPVIGRSGMKRADVSIAGDFSSGFGDDIRIALKDGTDTPGEFFF